MLHSETEKQYGKTFTDFYYHPHQYPFPGEGSRQKVRNRVSITMDEILQENPEDAEIAIVSHGGTLRVVLLYLMGLELIHYRQLLLDNTSVSFLTYENHEIFLHRLNDCHHLTYHEKN